jgi:cation diffusion facilitator CzcD-associated flavoprotein CzcO
MMFDRSPSQLPVAVIGAGPVGLAAAAHLVRYGIPVVTIEAGPSVAANLESYRHVRLFSPWRYNIDHAAQALLESGGWLPRLRAGFISARA